MSAFKVALFELLFLSALALESKCPSDAISKLVVCYYKSETFLINFNICNCTHIIFTNGVKIENTNITADEDAIKYLKTIKDRKANLSAVFTLEAKQDYTATIIKSENKSEQLINEIFRFLQNSLFDGVELKFSFDPADDVTKESYTSFVKNLSKKLSSNHSRVKRESYDVFEKLQDDITTAAYTTQTPKNSTSKTQSIKRGNRKPKQSRRKIRENYEEDKKDLDNLTLEKATNVELTGTISGESDILKSNKEYSYEKNKFLIFVRLSLKPEILAKKLDLKALSRYADYFIVPTHNIVNENEKHLTYHPSRLIGLSDILNTDSVLDLLIGMGAMKSKIVISLPATALKFQLKDENKNTPRSPSFSEPEIINQSQLCSLLSKGNWTLERDDDLTAPYAFSKKTWLAFEDEISVDIKGKYILLRELAGGAIYPINADDGPCTNHTGVGKHLAEILYKNFKSLERKPRALVLESLQEEIHDTASTNIEGGITISEYRIVRVVDHSGAVHVIRKNTKTQFECSRQGYFSHPLGCNKFYRCVKFDQYSDEFTVFEYDCPVGLAFDERWEVCVWPGSLPHGAPCTGSSEIAPVPRSHYQCPNHEGYFADPENCRWFFACLDHSRDGITPLTAYEFRCPFGLVFNEQKLACDWPWLVGSCGNKGTGIHFATFINGGNLETSLGQFRNSDVSFIDFGKKFKSTLREKGIYNAQGSYEGAQSAGFGYIASQFDDDHNRESFASFPDYEISGGRIFNKDGVVLNQNVAGISDSFTRHSKGGFDRVSNVGSITGASRSLEERTKSLNQEKSLLVDDIQRTPKLNFQKFEPASELSKTNFFEISKISSQGQFLPQYRQNLLSNSKFFPYSNSLDRTNEEVSKHYQHSTFEPTKSFNGKQFSISHGFPTDQPAVSVEVPVVNSTPGSITSNGLLSSSLKTESLSTSLGSFGSTPKPEFKNFERVDLQQSELSDIFFSNQPAVPIGIVQSFEGSSGVQAVNKLASVPVVTSKPEVQFTKSFSNDHNKGSDKTFLPKPNIYQENFKITDRDNEGKLFVGISQTIPEGQVNAFGIKNGGQQLVSENFGVKLAENFGVTASPSIYVNSPEIETKLKPSLLGVSLKPTLTSFEHSSIDQKIFNEIRVPNSQSSTKSIVVPQTVHAGLKTISYKNSIQPNTEIPLVTPKPDFKVISQVRTYSQNVADKSKNEVPIVTPQPNAFNHFGKHSSDAVLFDYLGVTPKNENPGALKVFAKESYGALPAILGTDIHSTEETNFYKQKETSQGKISYGIPSLTSDIKTGSIVQGTSHTFVTPKPDVTSSQTINSNQLPFGHRHSYSSSGQQLENFGSVKPFETDSVTLEPFITEKKDVFVPKAEQSNILTELFIEQQPVASVGSFSSTNINHTLSSPKPHFSSKNAFQEGLAVNNFNVKLVSIQPEHVTVTTPGPAVSRITSSQVTLPNERFPNLAVHYTSQYSQPVNFNIETFSPLFNHKQTVLSPPETDIFSQKFNNQQKIKSFSPIPHKTTSVPLTYEQETIQRVNSESSFFNKNNGYLSATTPKTENLGSIIEQNSQVVQFGTTERNQVFTEEKQLKPVINQQFNLIKPKPSTEEKRIKYIQQQLSVPVTSPLPEYQQQVQVEQHFSPVITTSKPFTAQEELVGLEISKSVELNPSQVFQTSNKNPFPNLSFKGLEIQEQPLHLLSQKTLPVKKVIQPFFQQPEKETVNSQISFPPENKYDKQYVFLQQVGVKEPKNILKQEQLLPSEVTSPPQLSTVSFSTVKINNFEQPSVYSAESNGIKPALPVQISFHGQISETGAMDSTVTKTKTTAYEKNSDKILLSDQYERLQPQNVFSSKINFLFPTSTELPQHTVIQPEDLSIRTHKNFHFQKINSFSSTPAINVFNQLETHSTSQPAVSFSGNSAHVFQNNRAPNSASDGSHSSFDSRTKYVFNPNIKIPEPPKEYILAQNIFTTAFPELSTISTTAGQLQSTTESIRNGFRGSTILLPSSQNKNSKTSQTVIDEDDDSIRQFFDKYSEGFGQVINDKNGKFVAAVSSENSKDNTKTYKEGSYSALYEVSSMAPRQKSRGRQYHGGITSGLKATNKYEEYEIEGDKESQRSFKESDKDSDVSKTTIDLKNLKVDNNKKTVIVVSQVSDANPVLIGKLAGQCSCQSNVIELKNKNKKTKSSLKEKITNSPNQQQHATISNVYVPPYESNQANVEIQGLKQDEKFISAPKTVTVSSDRPLREEISYSAEQNVIVSSTTNPPKLASSTLLSSLGPGGVVSITPKAVYIEEKNRKKQFRGKARFLSSASFNSNAPVPLLSVVPASEIANTYDYSILRENNLRINNGINEGKPAEISKLPDGGAAFDRYGPGGWRGFDETLQGSVDCKRPGLFRHPKYCNKFYACNYDPWKERYTLHVFNCPIHLTYDSSISACNWPVRGPACANDNLLV